MSQTARRDQSEREVTVKRVDLIAKLKANRLEHVNNYNKAVRSYKARLLERLNVVRKRLLKQ